MKSNRRHNFALATEEAFGCAVHAPPLLSAAFAYFCRSMHAVAMLRVASAAVALALIAAACSTGNSGRYSAQRSDTAGDFAVGQVAVIPTPTDTFYLLGQTEGRRHAQERPTTSLMVFPLESTNWSSESASRYRSGYLAGLGGK
jgi:hypothetical protein